LRGLFWNVARRDCSAAAIRPARKRRNLNGRLLAALSDAALGNRVCNRMYPSAAGVSEQVGSRDVALPVDNAFLWREVSCAGDTIWQRISARNPRIMTNQFTAAQLETPVEPFQAVSL
jgi:hypothetical protein